MTRDLARRMRANDPTLTAADYRRLTAYYNRRTGRALTVAAVAIGVSLIAQGIAAVTSLLAR